MMVNKSCVGLYLSSLHLSALCSFETFVASYHTPRRHLLEDRRVVLCEIFISHTDSPKPVCSTSVSEKLQKDLGAWTNPIMMQ